MKKKIILSVLGIFLIIGAVVFYFFGYPYIERNYMTAKTSYSGSTNEQIDTNEQSVLVVYFTRWDNAPISDDVDATSNASLMIDDNDKLYGNAEMLATYINDSLESDIVSIQNVEPYPASYDETVNRAREELDAEEQIAISTNIENIDQYDTIFVVYPLWFSALPPAVSTFLENHDFSDKTIVPIATQGSGGFGQTLDQLEQKTDANIVEGISFYCSDVKNGYEDMYDYLVNLDWKG